jgi:predicted TIM-barrel fold metal-dependent hydrolase
LCANPEFLESTASNDRYRSGSPEALQPIGETEFAIKIAARCYAENEGGVRVCAAIFGFADLRLSEAVRPVLEAPIAAVGPTAPSGGRFRGIRQIAAWDPDAELLNPAYATTEDLLDTAEFRAGFAQLADLNLSFDAWLFFHQIPQLTALAQAFRQTPIVLNHCGGVLGTGAYADRRDEVFSRWSTAMRELATCLNVTVKLGGLRMRLSGFDFEAKERAPSSRQPAYAWRPWFKCCIDAFGPQCCMFESNFPADKCSYGSNIGWNAMRRVVAGASTREKDALFWHTASRFYRLPSLGPSVRGAGPNQHNLLMWPHGPCL